jgi:hypothetical protein
MDRAGVAIVRGTCVGIEGAALEACGTPVIAETGKAFTIREGQAPQLAQDLISIMADVGRIADVEWLRRFSSTARKVLATINRMDGMLSDGAAAPAGSPGSILPAPKRIPSSPGDIDIPFDLF